MKSAQTRLQKVVLLLNLVLSAQLLWTTLASVFFSLSSGEKFGVDEMILTPLAIVYAVSAYRLFGYHRLAWIGSVLGTITILLGAALTVRQALIHISTAPHLDPSDGSGLGLLLGGLISLLSFATLLGLLLLRRQCFSGDKE